MYLLNGRLLIILGILSYIVGRSILIRIRYKQLKQVFWLKEIIILFFVLYILLVVSVTIFPLALWIDFNREYIKFNINLIPFVAIIKDVKQIGIAYDGDAVFMTRLIIRNVGGNILLFMPFGFLSPIVWNKFKHLKNMILLGLLVSISIELFQLMELIGGGYGRTVDIDDVICNGLGVILGYLIYQFMFKLADKFQLEILQNLNSRNTGEFESDQRVDY